MEITQIHIPDIPAFKSMLNVDVPISAWQSITDFLTKNWGKIAIFIIIGIIVWVVVSKPKKEKKDTFQNA